MNSRIKNSEYVGTVLTQALRTIQAQKESKRTAELSGAPILHNPINRNKLPIRVAQKRRKLIARGSGVYEDTATGDIWFREGEYLVRQNVDTDSIVKKYLESCANS